MKKYEVKFTRHTQHSLTITVLADDEDDAEEVALENLLELDEKGDAPWEKIHEQFICKGAEEVAEKEPRSKP